MIILSRYPSPYWTSPPGWLISQSMVSRGLRSSAFRFQRGIPHLFINWKSMGARILYTSNCRSHSMSHLIHNCSKLRLLAHTHSSLQKLSLGDCRELLFHKEGLPSNLRELQICRCNQLTSQVDWDLQRLSSLTHFTIFGRCEDVELFPKECLLPSSDLSLYLWSSKSQVSWQQGASTPCLSQKITNTGLPKSPILDKICYSTPYLSQRITNLLVPKAPILDRSRSSPPHHSWNLRSLQVP